MVRYELSENNKEHRAIAKNVNFGTFYGLFPRGLQKTLKFKAGVDKTVEKCEEILFNLKHGYKGLTAWQEKTKSKAAILLYSETWLGRRRYLHGIISDNWIRKSSAERCSLNTPIQGTAADILKIAVTRILTGLPQREWLKPILQIYDELTFIIPVDRLSESVEFIRACMEEKPFPEFDLPLIAEASAGPTFGRMEELGDNYYKNSECYANPTDTVCFRVFKDKKNGVFQGAKLSCECGKYWDISNTLKNHNAMNRGISFVVNYGGHKDDTPFVRSVSRLYRGQYAEENQSFS